uniref:Uncharacterized protein n=1 Tax=Euplotes harpa TaxID=151035 RepID=A0A7S3NFP5_9SPIT|mmetsp:Transcript_7094/g.8051  ORF Transcript_7094/g.8051 Transcript_7094/m.8051 type:complete len:177 (+) Transcript_7094:556-1086(+)
MRTELNSLIKEKARIEEHNKKAKQVKFNEAVKVCSNSRKSIRELKSLAAELGIPTKDVDDAIYRIHCKDLRARREKNAEAHANNVLTDDTANGIMHTTRTYNQDLNGCEANAKFKTNKNFQSVVKDALKTKTRAKHKSMDERIFIIKKRRYLPNQCLKTSNLVNLSDRNGSKNDDK